MAKVSNKRLYGTPAQVKAWKEESDFIGRNVSRITEDGRCLEIFAIAPKKRDKKRKDEEKEKTVRRPRRGNGYSKYKNLASEVDDDS